MSLSERLIGATLFAVALTAGAVSAVGHVMQEHAGTMALQVLVAALCLGAAAAVVRRVVLVPLRGEVGALSRLVRGQPGELPQAFMEPELQEVADGLRSRLVALQEAREQVERDAKVATEVLDTSPFGTVLADPDGLITVANPTFRRLFRLRAEPVGRRPIEVVPVVEVHEVLEEALAGRTAEKTFVTASQDMVARAQPLSGGRAIVRVEDITGIREAERARTDFVANVSHELRTPIAAIMGYLETIMLDAEKLPPDIFPLVETVERNAERLRDLFEDLLKLHRIEARRRELPLEPADLEELLEKAVGATRDRAHKRRQELKVECPEGLLGVVNPEAFTAIVANLVSNASAYSTEGGHIVVRAISEHGQVRVEVQDDGIGIAERHQERIFERFYRVDEARSRRIGGTGLGLAIVKHYALASKCNVTLRSKEGEGSTFTIHLPTTP